MSMVPKRYLPIFVLLVSCFALWGLLNNMTDNLVFRSPKWCLGVVAQVFYVGVQIAAWTWMNVYCQKELGVTPATAANYYLIALCLFIVCRRGGNAYTTRVDVNAQRFMNPDSMIGEVVAAASEKGRPPATVGELMQCVYRSLAACYADAIRNLSEITGKTYTSLNIVGGGCQDLYLNALTAEATGLEVFTGPIEGTAIGNLIVQMVAGGEFKDLTEARKAIQR